MTDLLSAADPVAPASDPEPIVDPVTDPRWAAVSAGGDLFSSPAWLATLRDGYGLTFRARLLDGGSAGFAWSEIDDVRGRRIAALPFSDFADPPGGPSEAALTARVADLAGDGRGFTMRLRTTPTPDVAGLDTVDRLAWHGAHLPGDEDELWNQLRSGARQNIRKARKAELRIEVATGVDALARFRALHVELRRTKYRMLAQPTRFFTAVDRHFGPDGHRVVLAHHEGRPVAGVLLLRHGDVGYYKFNASTEAGVRLRANDLVMWAAMNEARSMGCASFDFGVSDLDQPGLLRYKRKYATDEGEVRVLRRAAATPPGRRARLVGDALPRLTNVLTDRRCPTPVTARAGDVLYRFFC